MHSSQAGLQALKNRQGEPTMTAYARTKRHPPIFSDLLATAGHAVNRIATELAWREAHYEFIPGYSRDDEGELITEDPEEESDPADRWGSPEGYYE